MIRHLDKENYNKLFVLYIMLQPIIDIFTSYFLLGLETSITPGLILRNIALGLFVLYILFYEKVHVTYFIIVAVYYAVHFVVNYYAKDVFAIFQEVAYFSKYVFFLVGYFALKHLLQNAKDKTFKDKIIQAMWIAMSIISISILFAALTGTGIEAYASEKLGQTGWFFSGNQVGASMAILFPVAFLYTLKQNKLRYYIFILCNMIAMFIVGTKAAYLGIVLGLGGALFSLMVELFKNKNKNLNKSFIVVLILIVAVGVYTPHSYMYQNIIIHQSWQNEVDIDPILNGRELKSGSIQEDYLNQDFLRQLIGVGYGGNYESKESIVIIERDFHEIFLYYGIIGFMILLYYPIVTYLKILLSYLKQIMKPKMDDTMLLISITAAFGCAFIAGHVFFSPAVSIYLLCSMCLIQEDI